MPSGDLRPPDLEIAIDTLRDRRRRLRRILGLSLAMLLVVTGLITSYFQIEAAEVGMVTRFGAFVRQAQPGAHFKLPFGLERVAKVPVERQLKQEFGFRTVDANGKSRFLHDDEAAAEALMLTGDLNVATVEWIVQYKIQDPYKYVFKVRDVEDTFRLMAEATMREVVGNHSVTELITVGREQVAAAAKQLLADLCKKYETGLEVEQLVLQDVDPPERVRPSFNEVNQAIQERERAINEALAEYNSEVPAARGAALQRIQAAEGYAVDRVNRAKGDAQRFIALHAEYRKAPEVTRTRIHLETMTAVLPKAGKRVILDELAKGVLPLLQLGQNGK